MENTLQSIPSTIGGLVEGTSISNMLFGVSVAQLYMYTQDWGRDPKWVKGLASAVMAFETIDLVFAQRGQYFYSVLAITNPSLVTRIDWSVPVCFVVSVL
ncbi:hypothetical protein QCA50_016601 [Cerrena zonata]|uniref:Uncharacterized protein n=1 Tax=Cerrena zonata TaxID=2478898 RepID=A0AAW0FIE7_9APHY